MTMPNNSPFVDVRGRTRRKPRGTRTVGNFSLRMKVIVAFLIVALSAVGTVVFFSDITNRASLTANVGANLKTLAREKASTVEALLGKQIDILEALALSDSVQARVIWANAAYSETSDLPAIRSAIAQRDVAWTIALENDPLVQGVLTNVAARELQEFRARFPDNAEILVTDKYGATIAATNRTAKYYQAEQSWWQGAYNGNQGAIYISQPDFNRSLATFGVIIAIPIRSPDSQSIEGVLHALYRIEAITDELGAERFGETGKAGLLLGGGQMLTPEGIIAVSPEDLEQLTASMMADYAAFNYGGAPQLVSQASVVPTTAGRSSLTNLGWRLVVAQAPDEALEPIFATERTTVIVGLATLALAAVLAIGVAQLLSRPIIRLTAVAERIAAGDLKAQAPAESRDEIGKLAATFNNMTAQLRELIGSLEQRVEARTQQLRTSADVGRAAATILEPDQLLREAVNLITDRFGFYYTAVFTLDSAGKFAVLREASGEAGRVLKERGHKLEVGGQSMVGYATAQRKARIALDVGQEAVRFANPLLPDTRSEIALPLVVGDRVLGALDVQSTQEAAFDEASAAVLQTMADQIAIALNNARLYVESQTVARRSRALYEASREVGRLEADPSATVSAMMRAASDTVGLQVWWVLIFDERQTKLTTLAVSAAHQDWPKAVPILGFENHPIVRSAVYSEPHVINDPLNDPDLKDAPLEQSFLFKTISVPIISRGASVGTLVIGHALDQPDLAQGDLEVAQSLASLTAIAIENSRLLSQTQRALSELDAINRRLTGEGWAAFARRSTGGIMWISTMEQPSSFGGTDRSQHESLPEVTEALDRGEIAIQPIGSGEQLGVAVPIKLRDVVIGALRLVIPQRAWNADTIATLDSIAGHVAQAAENARLLEQTQRTAQREKAIAGAADKIHRSTDLDTVLRAAVAEINRITGLGGVSIQLGFGQAEPADDNGHKAGTDGGK